MIAYYPNLDYYKKEITPDDRIAMRNHEQSARLAQEVDRLMSDPHFATLETNRKIAELKRRKLLLRDEIEKIRMGVPPPQTLH